MIVINSNNFDYKLEDYGERKVGIVLTNKTRVNILSKILNFNIVNSEEELFSIEKRNLVNSQVLSKSFVENNDHINSFDVLIFDLIDNQDFYFHIIFKILNLRVVKKEGRIPEVVVINHSETIENIPLSIDKVFENKINKKEIKIKYSKNPYRIKERWDMLSEISEEIIKTKLEGGIILVITPGIRESDFFIRKLKNARREDLESYLLDENIHKTKFCRSKIYNKIKEKTTVLVTDANNLLPLPYENIEIIYDCYLYSRGDTISYNSRERSNLLKNYIFKRGEINIMTSEEFYNKSPIFLPPFVPYHDLYRYYILIVRSAKYRPEILFNSLISEVKIREIGQTLKDLNIVDRKRIIGTTQYTEGKILIDENILFSIPLSFRSAFIIYKVIKSVSNLPLFPFIVLASIIDITKGNFYKVEDPLIFYLNKWLDFTKEFKDLDVKRDEVQGWCKMHGLDYRIFNDLLEKVKEVYSVLNKRYDIEIGLFNVENLMKKSIKFLEKVYKEYIFHRKDKINHIYTNKQVEVKLNKPEGFRYPEQVISFYQQKNNKKGEMNQISFYTILN
jgi:hypothetical protein